MLTKVHKVKAMVSPVVKCGCENWTIKKSEYRRIDAFELWWWRRPLRVPGTARRSNQSTVKKINPEYSLHGRMLKLQYFGYLMRKANSLEKTLLLGKIEGRRRRGPQTEGEMVGWVHWFNGCEFEQAPGDGEGQGSLACYSPWGHKESDMAEQQQPSSSTKPIRKSTVMKRKEYISYSLNAHVLLKPSSPRR